jgi:hypothetical protein
MEGRIEVIEMEDKYQFKGNVIIKGKIHCDTGLSIGGNKESFEIGGIDNPVNRSRWWGTPVQNYGESKELPSLQDIWNICGRGNQTRSNTAYSQGLSSNRRYYKDVGRFRHGITLHRMEKREYYQQSNLQSKSKRYGENSKRLGI